MKKELKVVVDTNVFISLLLNPGKTLIELYEFFLDAKFTPILSVDLKIEILDIFNRKELKPYIKEEDVDRLIELLEKTAVFVTPSRPVNKCRDPGDNKVLEAAIEGDADFIVSGDKDLLTLKSFHKVPILKPGDFLKKLKNLD